MQTYIHDFLKFCNIPNMDQKNRRLEERFTLQLKAKLSSQPESDQDAIQEETIAANISSGGAFIQTKQDLPLASKVFLEFCLSFEDLQKLRFILSVESLKQCQGKQVWVKATAVIIRVEESGVGVIFDTDYQLSPM